MIFKKRCHRIARSRLLAALVLAAGVVVGSSTRARAAPQAEAEILRQLQTMSNDEVVRQLIASGLTRAEVRDQLNRLGYDPYLADQYFDAIAQGSRLPGTAEERSLDAFRLLGILQADSADLLSGRFTRPGVVDAAADSLDAADASGAESTPVFGEGVFSHRSGRFDPFLPGPVGDDYVLGSGDVVSLVLTGDVERVHERLTVGRSGEIFIPDVGLVGVQNRTLGELRDILYSRLGRVYSGVRREDGATTQFTVSVATLRAIQVRVLGEVVQPGAYLMSSVGSLLQALYFAGGPTDDGTYRKLLLNRAGEGPVEVDLYPYLTAGSTAGDPRMQSGDVVFVPPVGKQVTIRGGVRRAATYELAEGEGLRELIRLAGGLLPDASTGQVQIDRVLPSSERSPGVERVTVNAPLDSVLAGTHSVDLTAGDVIWVFSVSTPVRNQVTLRGAGTRRPGAYQLLPGMTVGMLIERSGGFVDSAERGRIRVFRLDRPTDEHILYTPNAQLDLELQDEDVIEVYVYSDFVVQDSIDVYGFVRIPGRYILFEGMTADDAILAAGGVTSDAETRDVEIVRPSEEGATMESVSLRVRLGEEFDRDGQSTAEPEYSSNMISATEVVLEPRDRIFVRRDPTTLTAGLVSLGGELVRPGDYALLRQGERLSSLLGRGGGLAPRANAAGIQLKRQGILVAVDYRQATGFPGSPADPVLQPGDSIYVPVLDNTITVGGSVNFPSRTVYTTGLTVEEALASAGGTTDDADLGRTSVTYANGSRATVRKVLGIFRSYPEVEPGSSIFVPIKDADAGVDWPQALGTTATVLQAVAVNIIAILSLVRTDDSQQQQPQPDPESQDD